MLHSVSVIKRLIKMSQKRASNLHIPVGSSVRQAFKSPFRSPRPSSEGQPSEKAVDKSQCESQTKEEIVNEQLGQSTSTTRPLAPLSHTTPQKTADKQYFPKRSFSHQFNSPFRSPSNASLQRQPDTPDKQLASLVEQENNLDKEITALQESGFRIEELQHHIDNLHRYNDVKDAAQLVLGRLAELEQITLKEMHTKYNVPLTDL